VLVFDERDALLRAVKDLLGPRARRLAVEKLEREMGSVKGELLLSGGRTASFRLLLSAEDLQAAYGELPLPGNELLLPFLQGESLGKALEGLGALLGWGKVHEVSPSGSHLPVPQRQALKELYGGEVLTVRYRKRGRPLLLIVEPP